jgi:hypothetical protein
MDARSFDAITRRASLLTLGAAGLAALGLSSSTDARKRNGNGKRNNNGKNGKNRKQNKGKINARCKKQVGECEAFLTPQCEVENCAEIIACCAFLGQCNVDGFFTCLIEAQQPQL